MTQPCSCDWGTGECQGPLGCRAVAEIASLRAQLAAAEAKQIGMLTKLAAECHRAKWQFDLSEDYRPSTAAARAMIAKAFAEMHRIGDMVLKEREALRSLDGGGK